MAIMSGQLPIDSQITLRSLALLLTLFIFSVTFHGERVLAADDDKCQFSKYTNTDSDSLKKAKQRLEPLVGKSYQSFDEEKYQFTVGICTLLPDFEQEEAAVVQKDLGGDKKKQNTRIVGSLKDTHIMTGTDWILLEYGGGEPYNSHCQKQEKRSSIMITCDENVDDDSAKMVFMEENNEKSENCYYLFELKHKAACPEPTSSTLSVGSILVIVFVCVMAVYLLFGFLYTRFVLGAKGMEQIPNYEFWKDFGNLQADGCDLVCRTKEYRQLRGEGGIGDSQLDSAEEIRDDNLLPM